MKLVLDPALLEVFAELGWGARAVGDEFVIGDYADGYRLMQLPEYVQLARRSHRGEPALKMWSTDAFWLQAYLAYWTARELRFRRGGGLQRRDVAPGLADGHEVEVGGNGVAYLVESATGRWAGFGVGNHGAAAAFSRALRPTIAEVVAASLGEGSSR